MFLGLLLLCVDRTGGREAPPLFFCSGTVTLFDLWDSISGSIISAYAYTSYYISLCLLSMEVM